MSAKELEQVVLKAIHDEQFRKQLDDDPEAALKSAGIDAHPDRVAALKNLPHEHLRTLAKAFGHEGAEAFLPN